MKRRVIPFAPVRIEPEKCLQHARSCFDDSRRGFWLAEHLMWVWLLRWVGAPA